MLRHAWRLGAACTVKNESAFLVKIKGCLWYNLYILLNPPWRPLQRNRDENKVWLWIRSKNKKNKTGGRTGVIISIHDNVILNPIIWRLIFKNQFKIIKFQLLAHPEALSWAVEMSAESRIYPVCVLTVSYLSLNLMGLSLSKGGKHCVFRETKSSCHSYVPPCVSRHYLQKPRDRIQPRCFSAHEQIKAMWLVMSNGTLKHLEEG